MVGLTIYQEVYFIHAAIPCYWIQGKQIYPARRPLHASNGSLKPERFVQHVPEFLLRPGVQYPWRYTSSKRWRWMDARTFHSNASTHLANDPIAWYQTFQRFVDVPWAMDLRIQTCQSRDPYPMLYSIHGEGGGRGPWKYMYIKLTRIG